MAWLRKPKALIWKQIMQREQAQQAPIASLNDDTVYTVAVSDFVAAQAVKSLGVMQ
jgi:hypothetical protein|tara:strand:- start:3080 stop:3247 length:168 start_codon:yes stop_codon:yes gene_type:complete